MIREVIKLVQLIREALPHQASGVSMVDLYFGDRLVQWIPLAAAAIQCLAASTFNTVNDVIVFRMRHESLYHDR